MWIRALERIGARPGLKLSGPTASWDYVYVHTTSSRWVRAEPRLSSALPYLLEARVAVNRGAGVDPSSPIGSSRIDPRWR